MWIIQGVTKPINFAIRTDHVLLLLEQRDEDGLGMWLR
jgi:hypothetical protein